MKKLLFSTVLLLGIASAFAQEDIATMRKNAQKFLTTGDIDNAVLVLTKAGEQAPDNVEIKKDLALAYFYKKDYQKGIDVIKPVLSSDDADVSCFQLAGTLYRNMDNAKEAEKIYKAGLADFPQSGPLYSEYGELLEAIKNNVGAVTNWEKGIEVAPSYAGNYYNAAVHYYKQQDPVNKVWAILYGEIYSNMESLNPKANSVKKMVLDAYKELFSTDLQKLSDNAKNPFIKAVISTFSKQSNISSQGLTPQTLAMIRTRFVLDWMSTYQEKFPFRLFEYHQQLMREGLFDAYNQWMFGPVNNMTTFEKWATDNKETYDKFTSFHTSRIFKMPAGQHYATKK